jgi:hypothetical protein
VKLRSIVERPDGFITTTKIVTVLLRGGALFEVLTVKRLIVGTGMVKLSIELADLILERSYLC